MDKERLSRIKQAMERQGIDLIVCKNPENVLYLSGYWPVMGLSLAIFPLDGEPILIVPEAELEFAREGWIKDIRAYKGETLDEIWDPHKHILSILKDIEVPEGARVGCELYWETMATNSVVGELNYASNATFDLLRRAWNAELLDITNMILNLRMIKTELELEKITLANELAYIGLKAVVEKLGEGVKESELAAEAERAVYAEGVGYRKLVRRARAFAFVMSGENSSRAWYPFNISSERRVRKGDVVLIEFNVCADGYWADVTRTWILGKPSKEQEDMFSTLIEAQEEAFSAIKDGLPANEADLIARQVIAKKGYSKLFPHRLGHGIGLRIHEPPALHPKSIDKLCLNMVITIEPGLYTKDFGIRIEDDVVVMRKGIRNLSPYLKDISPWS
ncbi:MAG: hypothetical protein DRN15_03770 [Thermoprotei archaeon]|nr:MAG: hypothetical protein DRM97_07960 [Thermoprotei archaeon]RLF24243.1 MAG: hypothetical protein DRN15_03770 [Thermoprotei archaeon]